VFHICADVQETLEAGVIVSVLLSFVRNSIGDEDIVLRKRLIKQVSRLDLVLTS
jgi:hypothetical protein